MDEARLDKIYKGWREGRRRAFAAPFGIILQRYILGPSGALGRIVPVASLTEAPRVEISLSTSYLQTKPAPRPESLAPFQPAIATNGRFRDTYEYIDFFGDEDLTRVVYPLLVGRARSCSQQKVASPGRITGLVPRCRPAVRTGVRRSCQSGGEEKEEGRGAWGGAITGEGRKCFCGMGTADSTVKTKEPKGKSVVQCYFRKLV